MYTKITQHPYTRRKYMGGVPGLRIAQFDTGNLTQNFPIVLTLRGDEACQIRDMSLEAARQAANKYLLKTLKEFNYRVKIRVYPHHVLRENKQALGAGADRVSDGMRLAFGKAVGSAARIECNQPILSVYVPAGKLNEGKEALRRASKKLPTPCRIVVEDGSSSYVT
jgi:large subunit ribosomal protein L10e